ncbi:MAG: outer membrane usher protein [Scandinavium sp.]|uniref:outer membrane usher protein n=1 Tax=Scandinavium sp. TaxID=2830653 RepID=UPI003F4142D8
MSTPFRPKSLAVFIALGIPGAIQTAHAADAIEFNTDVLDVQDQQKFDLGQFTRGGFILPGTYNMAIHINKQTLSEQPIAFIAPENDPKGSEACLSPEQVALLGIKKEYDNKLRWTHSGQCLDLTSLDGMQVEGDLGNAVLNVNLPQAYLEYSNDYWEPPSRWDNGIPGVIFDYNLNLQAVHQQRSGDNSASLSGNGTTGFNVGPWRFRADWQSQLDRSDDKNQPSQHNWDWSRFYAYRPLPTLGAKLTLGEDYLSSGMFDSFRFTGLSLNSDDNMLPPNLRGYAPEITGIAKTNARVTVSQQGRVLYETQVASGPFRIQDLNDAVSGKLDVRVEEQDGSVQRFQVDTASIPYLTRPGTVRYKFASGRPTDWEHKTNGPLFATGEFSWGISNGWSLYGGLLGSQDYQAASVGVGRDLLILGAISADMTQSHAVLDDEESKSGRSYRISYSKRFEDLDSQVTFAGYRFSERNFMSMADFLDAQDDRSHTGSSKEMYTITFNKQFSSLGLSAYLNFSHQTYWDQPDSDHYNLSLSRYFDLGSFKNLSLSLTAYHDNSYGLKDNGVYLSLSVPVGSTGTANYDMSSAHGDITNQVGYSNRIDERTNYQLRTGVSGEGKALASAYLNHQGDYAQSNMNLSYQAGEYSSLGMSLQGGLTATTKGVALHRSASAGGTRLMLDTDGVADVPVRGNGSVTHTNRFGTAVTTDVNSYYRNKASVDLNLLADNAEVTHSVMEATLTEGAIGYRKFDVIAGEKAMAIVRLADSGAPPFGASVLNSKHQESGIINDGGSVYLSGINPGESMTVNWDGKAQCAVDLPKKLATAELASLLLPCRALNARELAQATAKTSNTH